MELSKEMHLVHMLRLQMSPENTFGKELCAWVDLQFDLLAICRQCMGERRVRACSHRHFVDLMYECPLMDYPHLPPTVSNSISTPLSPCKNNGETMQLGEGEGGGLKKRARAPADVCPSEQADI